MIRPSLRSLVTDERGSAVEFAIVAPVMSLLLLGAFDVAHTLYTRAVLQGIVQKTARDSALESGTVATRQAQLDDRVTKQVKLLNNTADVTISRRYYRTFSQAAAAQQEPYTDTDHDGTCDHGEPYQDNNLNNVWDADGADAGQGGAKDTVVYTVTMSYPRMFPIYNVIGGSHTTKLTASTVLKNQPYGEQGAYGAPLPRNCP